MSTTEAKFIIGVDDLIPMFENHLKIPNNHGIIFSGKFGIGKTYFLNEFFENKKEEYEFFHLFPINYQISSNENVIELLKYDILVELLRKGDIFEESNSLDKSFISFIKKTWNTKSFLKRTIDFMEPISFGFNKLGKPLKILLEVDENFQKFKKDAGKIELEEFLKTHNTESDLISEIVKEKIQKSKGSKKSILILDDLDRMDPEHIFRILNVFSAHFDSQNTELKNKFGFDTIILVADIQNLKSIFHHKYGNETDCNGYFDKFFSIEVFQFENRDIVKNVIDEIISHLQIEDKKNLQGVFGDRGFLRTFLKNILLSALYLSGKEKLNLRQLLKGTRFCLSAFEKNSYKELIGSGDQEAFQYINIGIQALISIFGGVEDDFLMVLQKIKEEGISEKSEYGAYKKFSKYLFQKIKPIEKGTEDSPQTWHGYNIEFKNKDIDAVKNEKGIGAEKIFFFDLLIEYVQKKYYLEPVQPW